MVQEAARVYGESELVVKVYGPVPEEYDFLREGLTLIAFLSLPVNPASCAPSSTPSVSRSRWRT